MDAAVSGKRITLKRARPNPLFQSWLEDLHREAKQRKSQYENKINEALTSLSKYPLPLHTGAECAILRGFDKRLCTFLDKRLEDYKRSCQEMPISATTDIKLNGIHSLHFPSDTIKKTNSPVKVTSPLKSNNGDINPNKLTNSVELTSLSKQNSPLKSSSQVEKKCKLKTAYKPTYQSGGYAILLALLELSNSNERSALDKNTIIQHAQKYCDASFTIKKPETFYTAWCSMKILITKGLVNRSKSKKIVYSLTDEGYLLAKELLESSQNVPSVDVVISNYYSSSQSELLDKELKICNERSSENDCALTNGEKTSKGNSQLACVEMQANSFDVILLIDKNETSGVKKKDDPTVVQFKKYPHICHEYRSLKVGDYVWIARHRDSNVELVLPCIVERKRIDDLAASIKDGRFHEQKFRLRRCGINNVVYLIENYGSNKNVGLPMQSLLQALANTRVIDDFKVHITKSLTYSARFLAILTKRLTVRYKDKKLRGWDAPPEENTLMTFSYFNKSSVKSKPLTVNETFIKILLQLKGVSVEKAVAITSQYKTPHSLIRAYRVCDQKEGEILLANLKYGDLGRKVGPSVSKTIYQLFINMNVEKKF